MKTKKLLLLVAFFITKFSAFAQVGSVKIEAPIINTISEKEKAKTQQAAKQPSKGGAALVKESPLQLLRSADAPLPKAPSKNSEALLAAIISRNLDLAEILLTQGADINCPNCANSPLLVNASGGDPKTAIWAIQKGADVSLSRAHDNLSPLMSFVANSFGYSYPKNDYLSVIKIILNNGANVNQKDSLNNTAFHYLAAKSYSTLGSYGFPDMWFDIFDLLQQYGGDINAINDSGFSPLILGIQSGGCNLRVTNKFLSAGANAGIRTPDNKTAYDFVLERAAMGDKACNSVLPILRGGTLSSPVSNKTLDFKPNNLDSNDSKALLGPWKGVLRMSSPVRQVVRVDGVISEDGSLKLQSENGVLTYGSITNQSPDSVTLSLRSRVPSNPSTGASAFETQPFTALAKLESGVLRGSYSAPTDSGEFIICQSQVYSSVADCQNQNVGNDLARTVGNILGIAKSLLGR